MSPQFPEKDCLFTAFPLVDSGLVASHTCNSNFAQADFQAACVVLVGSGGDGRQDFQDAEIQDDADGYTCGCDPSVIES